MTKIYLSPSSQEHNAYAYGGTVEEVVCNRIVDFLAPILTGAGIEVKRNNPANAFSVHTTESNAWGADWHIPIHTNAGGGRGCTAFCYNSANASAKGTIMANAIYRELEAITPTSDRGVKTNQTFNEIIHTNAPCAYIEVEFHDSIDGAKWILDNVENIAKAIAKGIFSVLGIEYKEAVLPSPDYLATITEKDATIKALNEKVTLLINEAFATQQRTKEITDAAALVVTERDSLRNELITISGILKKY